MKNRYSLALTLCLSLFAATLGQEPKDTASPPRPAQQQEPPRADDDVVRITTNLVQVDAVITDKNGRIVTDLRPEEIEILEDGRPQKISNFSFVSAGEAAPATPAAPAGDKGATVLVPPVRLRPEQVRRTVALVVDDLGLSFESTAFVRQALRRFVDRQLQSGDLVAIIRTAGGMGALQQFTSDRRVLYAAIENIRWNPQGRGGTSAFAPLEGDPTYQLRSQLREVESGGGRPGASDAGQATEGSPNLDDEIRKNVAEGLDQFREDVFAVGTLGALSYVVRGMQQLPGRKSILLMSDGIKIANRGNTEQSQRVLDALRRLTDQANRAAVVIYTMDARGVQTLGLTAADNTTGLDFDDLQQQTAERRDEFFDSQSGLIFLARQTGGFAIRNNNDLSGGIKRVLEDQSGYYLIGYRPEDSTFDARGGRKFHKITLRLKRPGLSHRTRTGFYGVTDEQVAARTLTRADQLSAALTSPFNSGGVRLRLTSLYGNDPAGGGFMRSLLHIEGRDLTFTEEADGWHKADFEVLAYTFDQEGEVVDEVSRTHTVRVRGDSYARMLSQGFVYIVTVPIQRPGAYQLRTALRDTASARVGSASQFIEVPDLKKNRLTLSGVIISGADPEAKPAAPAPARTVQDEISDLNMEAGPAVRRFRQGMVLRYDYAIYNARADKATGRPRLLTQIRLYRDGQPVFAGREQTFDAPGQPDPKRLTAGGALQLATNLQPGEYILQVIVTDPLAKEKDRTATQWVDFEIVK